MGGSQRKQTHKFNLNRNGQLATQTHN